MRSITIALCLIAISIQAFTREVSSFDDGWQFLKGPFTGDPVLFQSALGGKWSDVSIPHTWNNKDMQIDKNIFYEGDAYYKKVYTPAANLKGKRVFLRFEGVGSVADVYVNRQFAGNHKGAYSAFAVEITKMLDYGAENEILVKVSNQARPDVIPVNHRLFGVYGGIYRPVQLIVTSPVNIAVTDYASPGVFLSQENVTKKSAEVRVKVKIENKTKKPQQMKLVTTIYERDGKVKMQTESPLELSPQGLHVAHQNMTVKSPHLWQGLEDPYLYKVVTRIKDGETLIDEVVQPLGLRHFELKASDGMYLNGKKVPMYGVCRHQDWWGLGSALTKKEHDTDLELIREIGATTIRLAHYQQAEYFYSRCDSIGFIVWAEIPFVNRVSTEEADNAKQQMAELIRQNYNHPSIYTWGMHNEVYTPEPYTVALTMVLNDLAKTEDPYRYTVSVNGYNVVDQGVNFNADIQGINHYFGWYNGKIGDIEPWVEKAEKEFPGYKVIFSEYGAEANIHQQQEVVGEIGTQWSKNWFFPETFATKFHEIQWGVIARHPYLVASYVWNTFDFATPVTSQGSVESRNMKGLVTFDRQVRKDPFYWYKANWSKEPVVYITQRRAKDRVNKVTPVTVYSNRGLPRLYVNGQEITSPRKGTTDVHYIFDDVELADGENLIEARAEGKEGSLKDEIRWNYSPENAKNMEWDIPKENKKEHIGL